MNAERKSCADLVKSRWESRKDSLKGDWYAYCIGKSGVEKLKRIHELKGSRKKKDREERQGLLDEIKDCEESQWLLANAMLDELSCEAIYDYGLCFDYVEYDEKNGYGDFFRWQFSWGGPSDELQFYVSRDFKFRCAEYRYMDWFDGASYTLREDDACLARELWQWFADCGTPQHLYEKYKQEGYAG